MSSSDPLFVQVARAIEFQILSGSLLEDAQVPSTNELATYHRINPATAAKGVSLLADRGILYRKRGLGVFVSPGARKELVAERQKAFKDRFVKAMVREAMSLDLEIADVLRMVEEEFPQPKPGERVTV